MVATIDHFSYYLYGRCFKLFTDHKPLLQIMTSERLNPKLRRFAFKLQHWLLEVEYLPGEDNTFADALSREERSRVNIGGEQDVWKRENEIGDQDKRENETGL